MPQTFNIPLVTVNLGTSTFGPTNLADTDTLATLTIDRTVTNGGVQGFNGQPATTTARISVEQSNDGGVTWQELASAGFAGGTSPKGFTTSGVSVHLWPGTSRQGRAIVTISGAPVAVQGTLVIS
jgi:hypothetical protein